jgi:hypothetical protein
MPIHDWTRVGQGIFHAFHCAWIAEIQKTLNGGVLPAGYYALAEQISGGIVPDVLALEVAPPGQEGAGTREDHIAGGDAGGVAVAISPPKAAIVARVDDLSYPRTP